MSEFKRKSTTGDFEVSEGRLPDFEALEPDSGFSVEQEEVASESSFDRIERAFEAEEPKPAAREGFDAKPLEESRPAARPSEAEDTEPAKKRYYNPGEVMKKKGCIGCGGMTLAVPLTLALLALVLAIF